MTHTYKITGMTCGGCEAKVKSALLSLSDVSSAEVSKEEQTAVITMDKHISIATLQNAIGGPDSKYKISAEHNETVEQTKSWFATYRPLLLIFAYITGVSLIAARMENHIHWMWFMNYFMAGFFLVFSFFKFLDLKGFAESYAMYDLLAMKVKAYGFIYPFIELGLGIAYLLSFNPVITNTATIIVMAFSSLGVIRSVLNKQQIRCACLGAVFNLPMSTVTIIEDLLMVGMALISLLIK